MSELNQSIGASLVPAVDGFIALKKFSALAMAETETTATIFLSFILIKDSLNN